MEYKTIPEFNLPFRNDNKTLAFNPIHQFPYFGF